MKAFSPDDGHAAAAIELLQRLVAFDTVSSHSNLRLIETIADYLSAHGVYAVRIDSTNGDKASLLASIGPAVSGGIVLSGHTDVVPVDGQAWSSGPFVLVERDGRLYGRGTADMKGFIAVVLACVPAFARARLRVPILIALSHDEEVGCLGAPRLIEALLARAPLPAAVFVGEPTGLKVADRHRGIMSFATTITGRGGHSSAPCRGVNAITLAARFVSVLEDVARELRAGRPEPEGGWPEYTTINIGRIEGGAAVNMIAEHCRVLWECRPEPGLDAGCVLAAVEDRVARLLAPYASLAPEVAIRTETSVSVPPLQAMADTPASSLALRLSGQNECVSAPFASEAGLFQQAGIAAVVCGPGRVSEAHQPDEFVARAQLDDCLKMMLTLADWACDPV